MSAYTDDAPPDGRIVELVKQTTSRLEILWDEVGYTLEEKRRQMQGLIDGVQTLCENKVIRIRVPGIKPPKVCEEVKGSEQLLLEYRSVALRTSGDSSVVTRHID